MDMGVENIFDSGNYCFVEWPSKIENLWPLNYLNIEISVSETDGESPYYFLKKLVNLHDRILEKVKQHFIFIVSY